jgi:hypothetical protein
MGFTKWLRRKVKKLKLRFFLWERGTKWFKAPQDVLGYERTCTAICRKLITHNESKYTIAPLSEKRYIINKELDIFVVIVDNRVEITNHVYHYIINLTEKDMNKLKNQFDAKVEQIRLEYESEIKSQINNTLSTILEKILNNDKTNNTNTNG